jgi:putative transposase
LFEGWGKSYCAFTYNYKDKDVITHYIMQQEEHHKKMSFEEELISLLKENGIEADEHLMSE